MNILQPYPFIKQTNIPKASALQFLGGTKITEFYGNKRAELPFGKSLTKFPYYPAPYHTARYLGLGMTLNIQAFKNLIPLSSGFLPDKRIDVIIYKNIPDSVREDMCKDGLDDADKPKIGINFPTYGFRDFLRFEPLLRWLPKSRKDFCSEDFVLWMNKYSYVTSSRKPNMTAPWDLYLYAFDNNDSCEIRTVWIGPEYAKKYDMEEMTRNNIE